MVLLVRVSLEFIYEIGITDVMNLSPFHNYALWEK
jgi:hypothetical protein